MSINVVGTLVDPVNQPMETTIRITATNSDVTVLGAEASVITPADGSYDFTLVEGEFLIDFLIDDEYCKGVTVLVDGTTPTPIELGTLLENHAVVVA